MFAKRKSLLGIGLLLVLNTATFAANSTPDQLDQKLTTMGTEYLKANKKAERLSALAITVSLPEERTKRSYYLGTSEWDGKTSITEDTLFQIGSITKSFTAARILQLEKDGKLNIKQPLGKFFPQYSAWKDVTIEQLLNMTSGIPSYTDDPGFQTLSMDTNLQKQWKPEELVKIVYPQVGKKGYHYSNTNYVLAGMIIEKVSHRSLANEFRTHLFRPLNLDNTFYENGPHPKEVVARKARSYLFDDGKVLELSNANLSWAGAAGGIISNTRDIITWVRGLFGAKLFPEKQMQELKSLVSLKTGEPISQTTAKDPEGFGLGVVQMYDPKIGRYWFYEGGTASFRAIYLYKPCNQLVISMAVNSKSSGSDGLLKFLVETYKAVLKEKPELACKTED